MFKKFLFFKRYWRIILIVLVAGLVLFFFKGIDVFIVVFVSLFLFYKDRFVSKEKYEEIKKRVDEVELEKSQMLNTPLMINNFRKVFELNVLQADINIVKPFKEEIPDKNARFIGALRIKSTVKIGIDLNNILIHKDDKIKQLKIHGLEPKISGFTNRSMIWEISEVLRINSNKLLGGKFWRTDDKLGNLKSELENNIRVQKEHEIDTRGIEEIDWMKKPLQEEAGMWIASIIRCSDYRIEYVNESGDEFIKLLDITNENDKAKQLHA